MPKMDCHLATDVAYYHTDHTILIERAWVTFNNGISYGLIKISWYS
jgi:hypothetical protein